MAVKLDLVRARHYAESLRERASRATHEGEHMGFNTYADHLELMAGEIERLQEDAKREARELLRHQNAAVAFYSNVFQVVSDSLGGPDKLPFGCDPLKAVQMLAESNDRHRGLLKAIVDHWNEFGGAYGLDERIDAAWRVLEGLPAAGSEAEK